MSHVIPPSPCGGFRAIFTSRISSTSPLSASPLACSLPCRVGVNHLGWNSAGTGALLWDHGGNVSTLDRIWDDSPSSHKRLASGRDFPRSLCNHIIPSMVSSSSMLQAVLAAQQTSHNITALFGPSLSPGAEILLPEQPDFYGQLQQRWTDYNAPRYSIGAIKPATEADVQHIVSC